MAYDAVGQPLAFAVERVERALMEQPIATQFPRIASTSWGSLVQGISQITPRKILGP